MVPNIRAERGGGWCSQLKRGIDWKCENNRIQSLRSRIWGWTEFQSLLGRKGSPSHTEEAVGAPIIGHSAKCQIHYPLWPTLMTRLCHRHHNHTSQFTGSEAASKELGDQPSLYGEADLNLGWFASKSHPFPLFHRISHSCGSLEMDEQVYSPLPVRKRDGGLGETQPVPVA